MSALGESFRTARESQGLSLADAADRIHIRSIYLAAIESEDWQAIGQPVYVRGFIRNYARFLGLDADAAVAQYSANGSTGGTASSSVGFAPSPRGEPSRSGLPRGESARTGLSFWAVLGLVVTVGLVAFVGYQYVEFRRGNAAGGRVPVAQVSPSAAHAAQQVGRANDVPRSSGTAGTPELRTAAKNSSKSNGLAVALKDGSWLRVVIDGKVVMEGVFPAGTSRSFAGRAATVRVGNAGGVNVTVNGKNFGPMGGLGDVAERSFQL